MRRGTTPTIKFYLPFDFSTVDEMWLTISQRSKEIITKTKEDMQVDDASFVFVKLTQRETLSLDAGCKMEIQVRGRTKEDDAFASRIKRIDVETILRDGVI